MNRRWTRRLLPAVLIVSLVWGGWQCFRWWRTGNYWANQYVGGLINAGSRGSARRYDPEREPAPFTRELWQQQGHQPYLVLTLKGGETLTWR